MSRTAVTMHPLDPDDAAAVEAGRAAARPAKGLRWTIEARASYDALMERVPPVRDVVFESDTVAGVAGLWVRPVSHRSDEALLHLHGGWFHAGSATGYRHLVAQIAARAGAQAFVPDYRLAPEHPFPAAVDDAAAVYRGIVGRGVQRVAVTGDSAGGNLALVLASCGSDDMSTNASLVGVVALSPITDVTLSSATYDTRADADHYFTKPQVAELVSSYLQTADPNNPLASPLRGRFDGLPPVRIHVGDDEVLLDDSRRYIERMVAAGGDAHLDIWMGMPHGFVAGIGRLKAAAQALDAIGGFLRRRLQA
jgi:monoterpene epsilon-lactone hydrolase